MGAELVPFSPLEDAALPAHVQGLYLGGGYPELYARQLSGNGSMRRSVRAALEGGLPCIAECGGFMYLTEGIGEADMAGVLPGRCFDAGRLTRFGYVTLRAKKDSLLCRAGETIRGHEFHHWDAQRPGLGLRRGHGPALRRIPPLPLLRQSRVCRAVLRDLCKGETPL